MEEKLLTVAQAAHLKGVTLSAVYKAVSQGRLAHQLVLGRRALREADVLAWAPTGRVKGAPRSADVKAKISQGQKKRWDRQKQNSEPSSDR